MKDKYSRLRTAFKCKIVMHKPEPEIHNRAEM